MLSHADRVRAFSAPHITLSASRSGVHKLLGGDTAGTVDPSDPRDIPANAMPCSATITEGRLAGSPLLRDWLGWLSNFFSFASPAVLGVYFCYFPYLFPFACFVFNYSTLHHNPRLLSLLHFPSSPPSHCEDGPSQQAAEQCLATG